MNTQQLSRFITYPSIVTPTTAHTVVLVDADIKDIELVGLFCKTSNLSYDVYLYNSNNSDLEWLSHITKDNAIILINNQSEVIIANSQNVIRYGLGLELATPLLYFQGVDGQ